VSTSAPNPYAPAADPLPQPARERPPAASGRATLGQRVCGGALLVNASLVLAGIAFVPQVQADPHGLPTSAMVVPSVIDLAIGASLLAGSRKLVPWATLRVAVGLVVFTLLQLQNPVLAVLQVVVAGAMLLLLVGDAGKPRIAIGASVFGLYALVAILGLLGGAVGGPLATATRARAYDLEPEPAHVVTGVAYPYTLTFPGDRWRLRRAAAAKKDQPLADRWIARPDEDAHVIVIAEQVPDKLLFLEPYVDAVLEGGARTSTAFRVVDRRPLAHDPENGRLVHATFSTGGVDFERLTAIVTEGDRGFQVIATAERRRFPQLMAELQGIVESLQLPAYRPPPSAEVEETPAGDIVGVSYPYTMKAPNDRWYLRRAEAAKKDQPLADRWLTRPDRGAHVLVIAERVPGKSLPLEPYADAVLQGARGRAQAFEVLGREPLASDRDRGRFLHTTLTRDNIKLEYYYGVLTSGDRGFQIVGFAERAGFPGVEAEIRRIVESFRLPPP
jgi:hypothetical protein